MHEVPPPPAVNIATLHESIKAALRAHFPTNGANAVPTVDYYARQGERVATPAIFFELDGIMPANPDDVGTEQLNCELEFSAYVLVAYNAPAAKVAVRQLAATVAAFVRGKKFGQPIRAAQIASITPDFFQADTQGQAGTGRNLAYETWRVSWTHEALIALDPVLPPDFIPSEVYLGFSPRVGPPHVDDYIQIHPPVPPA